MASVTSISPLSLPVAGDDIDAEPITNQFNNILTFLNDSGLIDSSNVNASYIALLATVQTFTGQKTFSTAPIVNDNVMGRIRVYNNSGGALAAGDALSIDGYDSGTGFCTVSKAIITDTNATTFYADCFADASISSAAQGNACFMRVLTGQDTSGLTVKRPVYLSDTAGGWKSTPTVDKRAQVTGKVLTVHASTGRILQFPGSYLYYATAFDI